MSELRADLQALATRVIGVDADHDGIINGGLRRGVQRVLAAIARE